MSDCVAHAAGFSYHAIGVEGSRGPEYRSEAAADRQPCWERRHARTLRLNSGASIPTPPSMSRVPTSGCTVGPGRARSRFTRTGPGCSLERPAYWVSDCDFEDFLVEACARFGRDPEASGSASTLPPAGRPAEGPGLSLAGTYAAYSHAWSPYFRDIEGGKRRHDRAMFSDTMQANRPCVRSGSYN